MPEEATVRVRVCAAGQAAEVIAISTCVLDSPSDVPRLARTVGPLHKNIVSIGGNSLCAVPAPAVSNSYMATPANSRGGFFVLERGRP